MTPATSQHMLHQFIGNKTVIVLAWCVSNTHYIANRTLKERVYIIYVTYMYKLYHSINWFMLFYNNTIYNCINWFILFHNSTIFLWVHVTPDIIPRVQLYPLHPLFLRLCSYPTSAPKQLSSCMPASQLASALRSSFADTYRPLYSN